MGVNYQVRERISCHTEKSSGSTGLFMHYYKYMPVFPKISIAVNWFDLLCDEQKHWCHVPTVGHHYQISLVLHTSGTILFREYKGKCHGSSASLYPH